MPAVDIVEQQIQKPEQAIDLLKTRLPAGYAELSQWQGWMASLTSDHPILQKSIDLFYIAFARMALRNGQLSKFPRPYHNEKHITDLLNRMMFCAEHIGNQHIPDYGWILLSLFAATHDLRQSERVRHSDNTMVGINETASYQETVRIIENIDLKSLFHNSKYQRILQLMIYGSTFSIDNEKNTTPFKGNLAKKLLAEVNDLNDTDKQLVLLASDIDTANVSLPITEYANSAINVFLELQSHHDKNYSAIRFFTQQQHRYFTELQKFNSEVGNHVFHPLKQTNKKLVIQLSRCIKSLPEDTPQQEVLNYFKQSAQNLHDNQ